MTTQEKIEKAKEKRSKLNEKYNKLIAKRDKIATKYVTSRQMEEFNKIELEDISMKLNSIAIELMKCTNTLADLEEKHKKEGYLNGRYKAIEVFLDGWADKSKEFLYFKYLEYIAFQNELRSKIIDRKQYTELIKARIPKEVINYAQWGKEWRIKMEQDVEKEKDRKRINLLTRVHEICGNITDAKSLRIGDNGEINGIIIGEQGRASIETVSAGGYNIQCFHFRVYVRKI